MGKYIDAEKLKAKLDEAAKQLYPIITEEAKSDEWKIANREYNDMCIKLQDAFRKGTEWMARQMKQEQSEVDFDKELKNKKSTLLYDAFGPMNGEQSLAIRDFAHYFYELGLNASKEE